METKGKKILIADDEPDILEIIQYNLAREGFQVSAAKDGDEALVKAKAEHPDLIILDIMMPKKNGVEVCQILRLQPAFKDTMIIFLTITERSFMFPSNRMPAGETGNLAKSD